MAIPESQLETWSSLGSVTQSKNTYATIKNALEASGVPYPGKDYESFLQGSYGNDTNVYADSDVDVVMKIGSLFFRDISSLNATEKAAYKSTFAGEVTYGFNDFKRDVTKVLKDKFGDDVTPKQKAVWIKPNGGRRNSDVLIAAQFRSYRQFVSLSNQRYDEGICFFLADATRIENYPKQHSKNCTTKHQATAQYFKPMVRIFKNIRNRCIKDNLLESGVAPSYFLEGLLYNVPNDKFGTSYNETFVQCFNWAFQADREKLLCANELHWLVREGRHTSWPSPNMTKFLNAARTLWNGW